ncbi:aldehyde dehydrogenase family protein [Acidaminococcus massiliensis]|uniref:aldehyde dehydrogenase family protein n=1 Tax=Acidaminococcus massiliensis TaxID=1852375 RepID=UPI0026DA711A|nr:aldehyde dehydrogenase family protein [Acidaminococcus massiliensis]
MAKPVTEEQLKMLDEMIVRAKKAAEIIATYDQERVDRLCRAVAWEISNLQTWKPLAKEAVEETQLGEFNSKVNKRNKIRLILRDVLRQKSVGIIESDPNKGITKYAKPVGLVGILVPTTNPCLTPAGQAIFAIKARDVIICSPHPRAKNVTNKCVEIMRNALVKEGAPADIIQCIQNPSIELSKELMKRVNLVIATGGKAMVRSAYSSGTPCYGSGAGNSTMIIDETANTQEAAHNTMISKTSDYGSGCSCDGNLVIHESVYDDMVRDLTKEGGYLVTHEQAEALKNVMWDETGHRLPKTVAISPQKLARAAGFEIPEDRKFIMVDGDAEGGIGKEHFFSSEKLTTLLALFKYKGEFQNAVEAMKAIYEVGGKGHSCGIYSFNDDHINRLALAAPVSRMMVRQPQNKANAGANTNGMPATSSMGCGTWGGNIVSENICLKHYMNTTWLSRPINMDMPSMECLFGEFYKPEMDR